MATSIEIGGETFHGVAPLPGIWGATPFIWQALRGWGDGSAGDVSSLPRGGGDGATFTSARRAGLELTLRGMALCRSWPDHWGARDRLAEVFDCVRAPKLLVVHEPLPKQTEVRRDGTLHLSPLGLDLRFEVPLISEDWRRFAVDETVVPITIAAGQTEATSDLANFGTAETHPVIAITGPADNPRLANMTTGEEVVVAGVVAAGDVLAIDLHRQAVTLNGAPADYAVTNEAWWSLGPGTHAIRYRVLASSAAASTAEVTYRSAWA